MMHWPLHSDVFLSSHRPNGENISFNPAHQTKHLVAHLLKNNA